MTVTAALRESRHLVSSFVRLREQDGAKVDDQARTARVVIITEGLGNLRDKNFYTAESIASAAKVFNGQQFYVDHPSEDEEENRPERSMRDLAGYFSDCQVGAVKDPETGEPLAACFATLKFSNSEPGRLALEQVKTALQYQHEFPGKDVYAGISINGGGVSHPGTIKDMSVNMVTEIEEAFSADIVTKPARGGRFLALTREAAAKAAAWERRVKREGQERRVSREGRNGMAAAGTVLKPVTVKQLRKKLESQALSPKRRRKIEALIRKIEAREKKKPGSTKTKEATTALGKKLAQMGEKYAAKQAEAGEAGGEMKDVLIDLQQDIGELSKMLGTGGAADDEGTEEDGMPSIGMGMGGEDEDEEEGEEEAHAAEGEDEEEKEGERAAEGEDEEEGERAAEGEGEDEEEGERAAEGEDEDEDEDEAEGLGMRTDDSEDEDEDEDEVGDGPPGAGNMRFKCGGCGETNEVAPPKGYRLVAQEAMRGGEAELRAVVTRMKRSLEAKEGRFVETNRRMRKVLEHNRQLRATILGLQRMREADVLLRKAGIPRSYMKPSELVLQFEHEVWPAVIEREKKRLAREAKWLGKVTGNGQREGRSADAKPELKGDAASFFATSYKESMKHAGRRR